MRAMLAILAPVAAVLLFLLGVAALLFAVAVP